MTIPTDLLSNRPYFAPPVSRKDSLVNQEIPHFPVIPDKPVVRRQVSHSDRVQKVYWGQRYGSGQCVALAQARGFAISGSARSWLKNAQLAGYKIGHDPKPGAVVVTSESSAGTNTGHVAIVTDVNETDIKVIEQNYVRLAVSSGTIPRASPVILGYIYPK